MSCPEAQKELITVRVCFSRFDMRRHRWNRPGPAARLEARRLAAALRRRGGVELARETLRRRTFSLHGFSPRVPVFRDRQPDARIARIVLLARVCAHRLAREGVDFADEVADAMWWMSGAGPMLMLQDLTEPRYARFLAAVLLRLRYRGEGGARYGISRILSESLSPDVVRLLQETAVFSEPPGGPLRGDHFVELLRRRLPLSNRAPRSVLRKLVVYRATCQTLEDEVSSLCGGTDHSLLWLARGGVLHLVPRRLLPALFRQWRLG